jgi:hypothetical protein
MVMPSVFADFRLIASSRLTPAKLEELLDEEASLTEREAWRLAVGK